eukprot:365528-Chlamydomonas_euryale.AAC.5
MDGWLGGWMTNFSHPLLSFEPAYVHPPIAPAFTSLTCLSLSKQLASTHLVECQKCHLAYGVHEPPPTRTVEEGA